MKSAEVITIGDEILIGQVVNTNAAWIGKQLSHIGIAVKTHTTVADDHAAILGALTAAAKTADIIIITGGLGPTQDDITKTALCDYFQMKLVVNSEVAKNVEKIFKKFGARLLAVNKKQAEVPDGCTVLPNASGTAPGMLFEKNEKIYVSLPGVPYEMKGIMQAGALPFITNRFNLGAIVHRTILTQGIGESFLAEKISGWENGLEKENIKLAYLPSPGMVRLRLSISGMDQQKLKELIERKTKDLYTLIPNYIFGEGQETLPEVVGKLLNKMNLSLAIAESCTGGNIAHMITSVPGSSAYFKGGVVAYDNKIKNTILKVGKAKILKDGAVSEQVAVAMAKGIQEQFKTDLAISCTGIAGPGGGTFEKPVGTIWIGISNALGTWAKKFKFGDNRKRNIEIASLTALNLLRLELLDSSCKRV